jgi:hypothetical protein
MSDIWEIAIARGMVIEGGQLLAKTLVPFVLKGLPSVYGVEDSTEAIGRENERRQGLRKPLPALPEDPLSWSITHVQRTVSVLWSPNSARKGCFKHYFEDVLKVSDIDGLQSSLQRAREARDEAAHPEFRLVEDGYEFFKHSERILTLLGESESAKQFSDYLRELSAIIAGGFRNRALLEQRYPTREYDNDFENATELWISGTNLRRIVVDVTLAPVRHVLSKKDGLVKILMHRPRDLVCKYAMLQEGLDDLTAYRVDVREHLTKFFELRAEGQFKDKLKIKTIDYMLAFGLDVMNGSRDDAGSVVYLRMYPLPQAGTKKFDDQPIIRFRRNDRRWYDFFKKQFTYHWEHELAEELPFDWNPKDELKFLASS